MIVQTDNLFALRRMASSKIHTDNELYSNSYSNFFSLKQPICIKNFAE